MEGALTKCLLLVVALTACERVGDPVPTTPPLEAFADIDWSTPPSDEALVRAMVGTGGSPAERAEVERMARELMLPVFHWFDDDDTLYDGAANEFRTSTALDRVTAFAMVAAEERANSLSWQTMYLAWARAQHELWPDEPIKHRDVAAIDPSTIDDQARLYRAEFERLRQLVSPRAPWLFGAEPVGVLRGGTAQAIIWMVEDNLRMASGGGYSRSNNTFHFVLVRHGVPTTHTPGWGL